MLDLDELMKADVADTYSFAPSAQPAFDAEWLDNEMSRIRDLARALAEKVTM
jgi:hypothetical protein